MFRLAAGLLALMTLAAPLEAACAGRDLAPGMTPEQRAAVAERLAATPHASGNHWRARRGAAVLHLIGTLHLSDPRLAAPAARLRPVIAGADLLLVEMAGADRAGFEAEMARRPEMMVLAEGSLPDLLPEAEWQALSSALRARGLPPLMGARMQPWLISMLMAVPPCLDAASAGRNGLDARLEAQAAEAGVPVRSLEPPQTAFRIFAEMPMAMQLAMVRATLVGRAAAEDLFETMLRAYFAEAHAEILATSAVLGAEASPLSAAESAAITTLMEERLLAERNHRWLPVLLQALEDHEGPVVAAFGAGHLSGEEGVLRLLEAEGFTLERLPF
jgi:hypothetical protein